jgi:hypothetical protein
MEWALFPVTALATILYVVASTAMRSGVHGTAELQAPLTPAIPVAVYRLAAR